MTNEEAIEFGNMWLQINEDCKDSITYAFFQIAIQALEQEHILDKIKADIEQIIPCGEDALSVKWRVLKIIDTYNAESEGKE